VRGDARIAASRRELVACAKGVRFSSLRDDIFCKPIRRADRTRGRDDEGDEGEAMGKRDGKLKGVNAACAKFLVSEMFEGAADATEAGAESERRGAGGDDERLEDAMGGEPARADENCDLSAQLELERAFVDWIAPEEVLLATRWDDVALAPANDDRYLDVDLFDIILDDDDRNESICTVSVAGDSARSRERGEKKKPETETRATPTERRGSLEFHAWLESLNDFTPETEDTKTSLV
jgi:hypothetical protein|tara:strand:- start:3930 stop:4640 length:711 start_codon:yes stop_codon:yes gene_type:complete